MMRFYWAPLGLLVAAGVLFAIRMPKLGTAAAAVGLGLLWEATQRVPGSWN